MFFLIFSILRVTRAAKKLLVGHMRTTGRVFEVPALEG